MSGVLNDLCPPIPLMDAIVARFPDDSLAAFRYMTYLWTVRRLDDGPLRTQLQGWVEAYGEQIGPDDARAVRDLIRAAEDDAR